MERVFIICQIKTLDTFRYPVKENATLGKENRKTNLTRLITGSILLQKIGKTKLKLLVGFALGEMFKELASTLSSVIEKI